MGKVDLGESWSMRKLIHEKVDWWDSQLMRKLIHERMLMTVDDHWRLWLVKGFDDVWMYGRTTQVVKLLLRVKIHEQ